MKTTQPKGKGQTQRLVCSSNHKPGDGKKHYDGDTHFCYNLTILIGCSAQVTTRAGQKYEGIFVAYSADQEVMLEAAHLVTQSGEEPVISTHYDVLVIPTDKVLAVLFENVDLSYPTREFQTDSGITASHIRGFSIRDKELTPWDGPDGETADDSDLDCSITENGWEPQEMFRKNEEKYGVVSSFKHDLSGYTTQLDKTDVEAFRKHEEQAALVAFEIEKNSFSAERNQMENGDDEEEAFSSVVRPQSNINHLTNNNITASTTGNDKYIVPSRRQHSTQHAAQPSVHSQPANNNGVMQMSANNANNRKPVHLQNSRNTFGSIPNNIYNQNQDRRNYDSRRSPHSNPYSLASNISDLRRMDDGIRPPRVVTKPTSERKGREELGKTNKELMDFHSTFNLQSDVSQNRRLASNPSKPLNVLMPISTGGSINRGPNGRNMSQVQGSGPVTQAGNNRLKKDISSLPALIQAPTHAITTPENSIMTRGTPPLNSSTSTSGSPESSPNSLPITETKSLTTVVNDQYSSCTESDSGVKESESSKKFTFNPNAKEFNPSGKSFPSRSPGTPPRAPSTPSSTPHAPPPTGHSYVPLQLPQTLLFAPQYAQASLTPSSNSTSPSVNNPPRHHPNHQARKGTVLGVTQRPEMAPSLQMSTAGPPLLAPTTLQTTGQHTQYFSLPGAYSQVRIHPQNMVSLYSSEGSVGTQMHLPMHYLPHNPSTPPNTLANQHNSTPPSNPTGNISAGHGQSTGHGYGSTSVSHGASHVGYPIVGLPVVGVSYPHTQYMNVNMITVPHVSHQGSGTILPHSQ